MFRFSFLSLSLFIHYIHIIQYTHIYSNFFFSNAMYCDPVSSKLVRILFLPSHDEGNDRWKSQKDRLVLVFLLRPSTSNKGTQPRRVRAAWYRSCKFSSRTSLLDFSCFYYSAMGQWDYTIQSLCCGFWLLGRPTCRVPSWSTLSDGSLTAQRSVTDICRLLPI